MDKIVSKLKARRGSHEVTTYGHRESDIRGLNNEDATKAQEICVMMGATGFEDSTKSFRDIVHKEINRPLTHWELMVNQSKMATAVGRRVFDEEEMQDSDSEDKIIKEPVPKKKAVVSRYLNVFDKKEEKIDPSLSNKTNNKIRSIIENPTEFGLWDTALNPVNVVKSCQRQPIKVKANPPTAFEKKLRQAQMEAKATSYPVDNELKENTSSKKCSLKERTKTGKYLHENDMSWCKKFTHFDQKEIIKWFKRFRQLTPKGKMTKPELTKAYDKMFIGNGKVFSELIFDSYQTEFLDFKDFLIVAEASTVKKHAEKLHWLSRILDLERKGVIPISKMPTAIGILDQLQEGIPDEYFDHPADYIPRLKEDRKRDRSEEKRLDCLARMLNPDYHGNIRAKDFRAIPARYISAREF